MLSVLPKPEYVVTFFGLQYIGAITVPIDRTAKEDSILKLCDFVEPKALITDTAIQNVRIFKISMKALYARVLIERVADRLLYAVPGMDSVAEMIFTTGTTGLPKGAMLFTSPPLPSPSIPATIYSNNTCIGEHNIVRKV